MAVSDKPWSQFSEADYADAGAYCDASLINLNTGPRSGWTKDKCKLRYREPGGAISRNGCHAAAARFNQTQAPASAKASARRKLASIYRNDLKEDPPDVLTG